MNIESCREYMLAKNGTTQGFPFDQTTLVIKVSGKMFALASLEGDLRLTLKCDPAKALELREKYPAVQPGYHTNKKHWNTIAIDGSLPENLIKQ